MLKPHIPLRVLMCMCVSVLQEMRAMRLPCLVEVFPSCFVPRTTLATMEQQARQPSTTGQASQRARQPVTPLTLPYVH